MNEVLMITGMALVTFGIRYPVLAIFSRISISDSFSRTLKYVRPAVLTAIISPIIFFQDEKFAFNFSNTRFVASILTAIIAWRTKNLLLTILLGMLTLWIWPYLLDMVLLK